MYPSENGGIFIYKFNLQKKDVFIYCVRFELMITRILYSAVALATFLVMIPDTGTAATPVPAGQVEVVSQEVHEGMTASEHATMMATEEHGADAAGHAAGPHIPNAKGDIIEGWEIAGIGITNTVFSTWIFVVLMMVLVGVFSLAIRTDKMPRIKAF